MLASLAHAHRGGTTRPDAAALGPVTVADLPFEARGVVVQLPDLRGVVLTAQVAAHAAQLLGELGEPLVVGSAEGREPIRRAAPPFEGLQHERAAAWHGELEVQL